MSKMRCKHCGKVIWLSPKVYRDESCFENEDPFGTHDFVEASGRTSEKIVAATD